MMDERNGWRRLGCMLAVSLFICAGLAEAGRAQTGWTATHLNASGQDLNAVFFLDSKRGWVAGDGGQVWHTEDGGRSWTQQQVGLTANISDLYFRDRDNGYLLAGNRILTTTDSGDSWHETRQFQPAEFGGALPELYSVRFANKKKGWIVGNLSRGDVVTDSLVLFTADGGATWLTVVTPVARGTLLSVSFVNEDEGWIVGRGGVILRSSDGGRTWVQQESNTKQNLYALTMNKKRGVAVGGDGLVLQYER